MSQVEFGLNFHRIKMCMSVFKSLLLHVKDFLPLLLLIFIPVMKSLISLVCSGYNSSPDIRKESEIYWVGNAFGNISLSLCLFTLY